MPGFLITDGYDLIAFVPNRGENAESIAVAIARDPRRASRRGDNHGVIFDLRGTSIGDESNAGFLDKILYPIRPHDRQHAEHFPAAEFTFDLSFNQIMFKAYTSSGLKHRLQDGPLREHVPFLGHGYAGPGYARVKRGHETEMPGVARDANGFEPVPEFDAPQAA